MSVFDQRRHEKARTNGGGETRLTFADAPSGSGNDGVDVEFGDLGVTGQALDNLRVRKGPKCVRRERWPQVVG